MPDEMWVKLMMPAAERGTIRNFFRFVYVSKSTRVIDLSNLNRLYLYSIRCPD